MNFIIQNRDQLKLCVNTFSCKNRHRSVIRVSASYLMFFFQEVVLFPLFPFIEVSCLLKATFLKMCYDHDDQTSLQQDFDFRFQRVSRNWDLFRISNKYREDRKSSYRRNCVINTHRLCKKIKWEENVVYKIYIHYLLLFDSLFVFFLDK